jgi:hypothetical protein
MFYALAFSFSSRVIDMVLGGGDGVFCAAVGRRSGLVG